MRPAAAFALALLALATPCFAQDAPPEPAGYRMEAYRAPTPATLAGATVVTTKEAEALWRDGAIFVDVLPQPKAPKDLAPGTIFRLPPRDSVPGAIWLPDVGYGAIAPETEGYFRQGLDRVIAGKPGRAIVLFCERNCWMSWNAAKRAVGWGYDRIHWYADGTTGWREAGLPLERVEPAPGEGR